MPLISILLKTERNRNGLLFQLRSKTKRSALHIFSAFSTAAIHSPPHRSRAFATRRSATQATLSGYSPYKYVILGGTPQGAFSCRCAAIHLVTANITPRRFFRPAERRGVEKICKSQTIPIRNCLPAHRGGSPPLLASARPPPPLHRFVPVSL